MKIFARLSFRVPRGTSVHFLQTIVSGHEEMGDVAKTLSGERRQSVYACALLLLELSLLDVVALKHSPEELANAAACLSLLCHSLPVDSVMIRPTLPGCSFAAVATSVLDVAAREVELKTPTTLHFAKRYDVVDLVKEKRRTIALSQILRVV
eukprot:Polyplicarium_translucidae@DN1209_c0_g1_i1.p1